MEPILVLILFSLAMFIGCFLAGLIPLAVPLSEDRMEVVTVFGAGLLIGTALTVIVPEGVNTLLLANKGSEPTKTTSSGAQESSHSHSHSDESFETHNIIGLSLLLGFLLMLLIDQCAGGHHRSDPEANVSTRGRAPWMTTLGLVVHAAADGIALGAAVSSSHTDVEMIVFFAIMLHKSPAAFGLVTFLLHENLDIRRIKRHLLLFALAAPLGALVTYVIITRYGSGSLSSSKSAGVAMLFSAGTFLYVSTVHVLPELTEKHSPDGKTSNSKQFTRKQLLALVSGSLLPLILTFGHHH